MGRRILSGDATCSSWWMTSAISPSLHGWGPCQNSGPTLIRKKGAGKLGVMPNKVVDLAP
ncbi:MAG: hypothetical protein CM15mP77_2860 [Synechococcus sp.]|nr:MAG: hypothetical protein CM15mP77_2860 [Synechococcus sp.]